MRKKAYIIGGGPSLKHPPFPGIETLYDSKAMQAALSKEVTIGCNKAVLDFDCTIMAFHDDNFLTKCPGILGTFTGSGGIYAPLSAKPEGPTIDDRIKYVNQSNIPGCNMEGIFSGNNCGTFAMVLAVALGYEDIYLLGMDCRYDPQTNKSHFHDGYITTPETDSVYFGFAHWFEVMGAHIKKTRPGVNIYNCTYVSVVDCRQRFFPRITTKEAIYGRNHGKRNK